MAWITHWICSVFIWALSINPYLEKNIIFYLVEKFTILSNKNTFTNPFYYYFWNIPATYLPWSIFAIIGTIYNLYENKENKYILSFFPLILIGILSIFSTKTPYYTLQISSIFTLNTYVGIKYLFNSKRFKNFYIYHFKNSSIIYILSDFHILFFL